jgi:predicted dehydrogenase
MSTSSVSVSTRRGFITTSSALVASAAAAPRLHAAEDEKLSIGIIGSGGRGRANLGGVRREHIEMLCDVNPGALGGASKQFPKARTTTDWREVVKDPKVNAVVISTADHHHALAAVAAMREGKHVYCEKPLGHTVYEARLMQQEYNSRRGKIATQMGTQIHATNNYRRVVELVQAGAVGTVTEAHVWCNRSIRPLKAAKLEESPVPEDFNWDVWLGPAPDRPHSLGYWKGGNLNWNRRWDFGNGVLGDMGSHLIDLPYWALNLQRPSTVASEGPAPSPVAAPPWQVITWTHEERDGAAPASGPIKLFWYHGPDGMKRREKVLQPKVGSDTKIGKWGIGVAFVGDKGVLVADYGKLVLSPGAKFKDYKRPEPTIPNSIGHYNEWIKAAKTGGESLCNFDYSGRLIENNLLGIVAHRAGEKIVWNAQDMKVQNVKGANQYVTKTYRKGWEI